MEKLLFIRIDRIGDLALTLPSDRVVSERDVTWLINRGLEFLPELSLPRRKHYQVERDFAVFRFFNLLNWLKGQNFTHVLVFHAPWWISVALWLARIPWRGGRRSQWHSFLFFNKGLRQSRLMGEKSELDYNIELVAKSFSQPLKRQPLQLSSGSNAGVRWRLDRYFVVHPGMSGSAKNWSPSNFAKLILELGQYAQVVVTGTNSDAQYLNQIKPQVEGRCLWLVDQLSQAELVSILQKALTVVAPSTGVAHLAAASGAPTIGIYSPVKSQSAVRWGPQGVRVKTLTPHVDCPAVKKCLGAVCPHFDCMDLLTVTDLMNQIKAAGVI